MNAKALLALIDECGMIELVNRSGRDSDGWIQETILRALRLLAAAEANDGNCPETEAAMCRYTGGEPVTFPKGLSAVVPYSFAANLERERNGLAARVGELEAERDALKRHAEAMADAIQFGDMAILTVAKAAADSYRSDYPKDPK